MFYLMNTVSTSISISGLYETAITCFGDVKTVARQSGASKSVNNLQSGPSEDTVCLSGEGHQGCLINLYSLFRPWLHTAQTFCREMSTSCACDELRCHTLLEIGPLRGEGFYLASCYEEHVVCNRI